MVICCCCCWWESAQQLLFIIIFRNKIYYVRVRLKKQSRKEQANTRAIAQKHIILYPSSSVISFNSKVRGERIVSTFVLLTFFQMPRQFRLSLPKSISNAQHISFAYNISLWRLEIRRKTNDKNIRWVFNVYSLVDGKRGVVGRDRIPVWRHSGNRIEPTCTYYTLAPCDSFLFFSYLRGQLNFVVGWRNLQVRKKKKEKEFGGRGEYI